MQFQVKAYEKVMPQDDESLIRFFASSLFPGIGKQSAKLLVETLGPNVIERIDVYKRQEVVPSIFTISIGQNIESFPPA